jgi:hypothetical protein
MFEACLTLPQNPSEARLVADSLEALARALREWPVDTWLKIVRSESKRGEQDGLFERLLEHIAPMAIRQRERGRAIQSAEAAADVLRCLWPESVATASGSVATGAGALA